MAIEKKMDEPGYEDIVKELSAVGELIRTHQNEKQSVMNGFDNERKRFHSGVISRSALASSIPNIRKLLRDLDKAIRQDIRDIHKIALRTQRFADRQAPKSFRATMSGLRFAGAKGKRRRHRKR